MALELQRDVGRLQRLVFVHFRRTVLDRVLNSLRNYTGNVPWILMICAHYKTDGCTLAAKIAGHPCPVPPPPTCAACKTCDPPCAVNWITVSLAIHGARAAQNADALARIERDHGHHIPMRDSAEVRVARQQRFDRVVSGYGVGSKLWRLLASLGIAHTATCSCLALAEEMNALGSAGCRRERTRLVEAMRSNAKEYGWGTVATAAAKALASGLAWKLDLRDVYGSLLDEAILQAESQISNLQLQIVAADTAHRSRIDIVIPVGPGSHHADVELRYALRSIQRHARGVRAVWIVGHIPAWLHSTDTVRLAPMQEIRGGGKGARIASKIEWACDNLPLTPTFALWNDDYLLLRDLDVRDIPAWYQGQLFRPAADDAYGAMLQRTAEALTAAGLPALHYDVHLPMLIEVAKFRDARAWWQKMRDDGGMVCKSIYANLYHADLRSEPADDTKLADQWPTRIDAVVAAQPIISYGNPALAAGFADWMRARFPDAHPAEQIVIAVLGQFRGGTSCVAGLLHALGVSMGSGWHPRRSNVRGTFEGSALSRICRQAFREPALTESMPAPWRIRQFRRWAERRRAPLIGAKHPTLCLCVPELIRAWPAVRFVAVDRPAVESIVSIGRAMRSWTPNEADANTHRLIDTRDADLSDCGRPVLRLAYHAVLADPAAAVDRLIDFCGLTVAQDTRAAAIATVDATLRTCHV